MNIIGRLTRDAEVRITSQGKQVVNFTLAVNEGYKSKEGQWIEQTEFFDCSYWRTPNVAKILTKGLLVELLGRVSARAWTNKDGEPRAGLNFRTSDIKPLAGFKKNETVQAIVQKGKSKKLAKEITEDDLPF